MNRVRERRGAGRREGDKEVDRKIERYREKKIWDGK